MQRTRITSLQLQSMSPQPSSSSLHAIFIRNVAHELRTPLAVLHGHSSMLHDGRLGRLMPEQQQAVSNIVKYADKLRRQVELIEVLLAVEAGTAQSSPVSLAEITARVIEARRTEAEAGLTLEMYCQDNLPPVSANEHQVQEAVDCLIDNALKFTPKGLVTAEVYAEDGWVCLAVSDTGIGMAPEEMARILLIHFYQADGSSTRRHGGYGLGLTVVGAVIRAHCGQIEFASQPSVGSRFTMMLRALSPETHVAPSTEHPMRLRRILVVDDEENIALILQAGLETIPDCEVSIATNAMQALRLSDQQPFDLLITDYMMPEVDGITLADKVRELYPQTAIVMVTAYGDSALRERANNAAIRRVLDKPVQMGDIREVAMNLLGELEQH